jgi:thiamine pyrophosphokinase
LKWKSVFHRVVVVDESSTTEILEENIEHVIEPIRDETFCEGESCGLLPVGCRVENVTTSGFVWNLNGEFLELGKRISSSNKICPKAEVVRVLASQAIVWTCSYSKSN